MMLISGAMLVGGIIAALVCLIFDPFNDGE